MKAMITTDGLIAVPQFLLKELGVRPGDELEIEEIKGGITLRLAEGHVKPPEKAVDLSKYGTLRDKIKDDRPPLDMNQFRDAGYDPVKYRERFDYEEYRKNYCPDKYREWYEQTNNRD